MTRSRPFDHDQHLSRPQTDVIPGRHAVAALGGRPAIAALGGRHAIAALGGRHAIAALGGRHAVAALGIAATVVTLGLAGCGGGGGSDAPAVASGSGTQASGGASSTTSANAATSASGQASNAAGNGGGNGGANNAGNNAGNTAASLPADGGTNAGNGTGSGAAAPAPARLADFAFYRLGTPGPAGTASLRGDVLAVEGWQSMNASLVPGACNGGTAFNLCASAASANVFTLCSSDGGGGPNTDRIRSRYVLFDPSAERITDTSVLRNLSFSGFENCGQDNVGAQPKSAPSATLSFNANGDLTLVRYDQNPARSTSLPGYFVSLDSDTVSGGQSARFNLYRSNGRYLIVATSMPVAGITAADPGTLIAFVQN